MFATMEKRLTPAELAATRAERPAVSLDALMGGWRVIALSAAALLLYSVWRQTR